MKARSPINFVIPAAALAALVAAPASAWVGEGHQRIARSAVAALPDDMPSFFRHGADAIAHVSWDPDVIKHDAVPQLKRAERPEHYLDLEYLEGRPLPPDRYAYLAMLAEMGLDPMRVGLLPYSVTEWAQRLTIAFAEYRRFPENPTIRAKCLVYAGILAHYAADTAMPLHTTVHYDGRVDESGKSPRSGIHLRVDGLIHKLPPDADPLEGIEPVTFDELLPAMLAEFERSHALVDRVYELEPQIPAFEEPGPLTPQVKAFTLERYRAATAFTASLYRTAWEYSAQIELPPWINRDDQPAAQ